MFFLEKTMHRNVHNLHTASPLTLAAGIRVDRDTRWGNPFRITPETSRSDAIERFRQKLWADIQADEISLEDLAALDDKPLLCHCAPRDCHGDVLAAAAAWAAKQIRVAGDVR